MRPIHSLAMTPPRALIGNVRADANVGKVLSELSTGFTDFKARNDTRLGVIEASLDSNSILIAANINGGGVSTRVVDPEYTAGFTSYVRAGGDAEVQANLRAANLTGQRGQINAAMSEGSAADGGYLAPTEWDRKIGKAQLAISPMRRISQVQTTGVQAFSTLWSNDGWGSGWVGESAARPQTANTQLSPLTFAQGEIYAMPAVTQRLLDDAEINIETWLSDALGTQFDKQEGIAFLSGDGSNKPYGLLQYVTGGAAAAVHPGGNLDVVNSGNATTIPSLDILVDLSYGLAAPYRQNATWLMNSATAGALSKLKDSTGTYLWQPSKMLGQPDTLLGRPVELDENMPSIAAGNLAVAFGDFRSGYLINDRTGIRILRDPYTAKPFVLFYATRRVGGGVLDPRAIRLLKISV